MTTKIETVGRILLGGAGLGALLGVVVAVLADTSLAIRYSLAVVGALAGAPGAYFLAKRYGFIDGKRSPGRWTVTTPGPIGLATGFLVFAFLSRWYTRRVALEDRELTVIGGFFVVAVVVGLVAYFVARVRARKAAGS